MHKFPHEYPKPEKKTVTLNKHEDPRKDDYFWLRERENPQVIDYLNKENAYTAEVMKPVQSLEEKLFQELKSRVKEDESSAPVKDGDYYYQGRYEIGQQYPLFTRRKGSLQGAEEILINVPELAKGHSFYQSTGPVVSPNQQLMAFSVDTVGRRFFTIYFKDLKTGKTLPDKIENVRPNVVWANDNETIFYSEQHPETLRSEKIYRYSLKTHKKDLVYYEKDDTFSTYVYKSLSEKYIYIGTQSTLTTEVMYLDANKPYDTFKVFAPREREHEYSVTDGGDKFYIISNKNAKNYKLMTAEIGHTQVKDWKELIPHRADTYLQDVTVFKNYLVLEERKNGLTQIQITDRQGQHSYYIPFADESYLASVGDNREYDTESVRFDYESMRRPPSVYDINMKTHQQELKKTHEVPNYDANLYRTERVFFTVRDGTQVPVSLIMKRDQKLDGTAPMLIYGYGSYGANMDPWFSSDVFSLVDRGFIYAKAHIRGGSEMGRDWYDNGRTLKKKNTFYDFIDCTDALVKAKYADPKRVYAMGGSAGGLLMGAIMNMRPDLYHGIVAQVPFVDVITTMLDESIPLTTSEYDEWGNPNDKTAYDYIKSYSPYDNVKPQAYPNTLVTTGLHDSQVQYWEPAKWVSKLRENNKGDSVILLKTDMESGHGGASGRFDQLKDTATEYAFILMIDGK
ncbi:S9 family peptidase [Bdellovibrio sp. HCB-162]|uniref:S9 family peptidase n=1 Tax=Bdellovibrio sp. HCB-162 TaxID=3394234 RepID=UPI0039BC5000